MNGRQLARLLNAMTDYDLKLDLVIELEPKEMYVAINTPTIVRLETDEGTKLAIRTKSIGEDDSPE